METLRARPESTRPVVRRFSLAKSERLFSEKGWRTLYAGEKFIVVSPTGRAWRRIKNRGQGWRLEPVVLVEKRENGKSNNKKSQTDGLGLSIETTCGIEKEQFSFMDEIN